MNNPIFSKLKQSEETDHKIEGMEPMFAEKTTQPNLGTTKREENPLRPGENRAKNQRLESVGYEQEPQ
jgi:hypothetical protein